MGAHRPCLLGQAEEMPMLPIEALALARLPQGRGRYEAADLAEAALLMADLRMVGWDVVRGDGSGSLSMRAAVLAAAIAGLARRPTAPKDMITAEQVIEELQTLGCDLASGLVSP